MSKSIRQILDETARKLSAAGIDQPRREAARLIAGLLDFSLACLYSHADQSLDDLQMAKIRAASCRRAQRVPLAYILGTVEFAGLTFLVGPGVLTPRPDSECLVEAGLSAIERWKDDRVHILDLCTGTGCIGISLAVHQARRVVVSHSLLVKHRPAGLVVGHSSRGKVHVLDMYFRFCAGEDEFVLVRSQVPDHKIAQIVDFH